MSAASLEMKAVDELCSLLKKHGVRHFQGESLVIDFAPPEPKAMTPQDLKAFEAEADADKCKCGHQHFMHMNGLCTAGCATDKCLPDEVAQ